MATRFRRSFIAKMSSILFICKSFFQLSTQKVLQGESGARTKYRSEARSCVINQVSVLGRVKMSWLGKLVKLSWSNFDFSLLRSAACCLVLGLGSLGVQASSGGQADASHAMDTYKTIDRWVRQWEVDDTWKGDEPVQLHSCISVTLRLDGQVIGRGQVVVRSTDSGPWSIDQAARMAIAQARAWVRKITDSEPSDQAWSSLASRVMLSVELADRMVPMGESSLALPSLGLSPGIDGLVMRLGERVEVMTPDEMASLGFDFEKSAYAMAVKLSGDGAMGLSTIQELLDRGYTFARFTPIWIAQPGPSLGGVFIDRGSRMIDESSVGTRSIRDMGKRIAGYLVAQRWPGAERYGMTGTRSVVSGRASPEVSPVYEQALVATALIRFGDLGTTPIHTESKEQALKLLRDLAAVEPGEPEPDGSGLDAAACVIALSFLDRSIIAGDEGLQLLLNNCVEALDGLYEPTNGFADSLPVAARGLVVWAMVLNQDPDADDAVRMAFREAEPGELVSLMPFLGWAEIELAQDLDRVPADGALNQMRSRIWDHQLVGSDLQWQDRDFGGAIVFTKGSSVLPSSDNLRPIAIVCSMLGDSRLTPGTIADPSVAIEIGRVAKAMRFVDQLVMNQSSAFLSRSPKLCVGGVRGSLWDWRVSPVSSAIALMAAVEFEHSIKAIQSRTGQADKP